MNNISINLCIEIK